MKNLVEFLRNMNGATFVEYLLLAGLIALVCVVTITNFGQEVKDISTTIVNDVDTAINGS